MDCDNLQYYRLIFNRLTKRLCGLILLVRLVRRACLIFVLALVLFSACACAMLGAAEQSETFDTVLFARGPVSQRQANLGLPVLVRLKTILCSVTNSCALI